MITARVMKNSETAKKYYTEHLAKAEYYSNGSKVGVEWFGLGCTRLGLEPGSKVTQEAFERLCDNLHPQTGEKLTVRHRSNDRRVCTDFVNSTLKSVSIMALLAGDTRILDCHEAATHTAMIQLEKRASTRVRKGRLDGERRTGELVAARVSHLESRALDPQLHTHHVVFNATWDPVENRWKALQTTEIFEQLGFFTEIYRSELAQRLKAIGYRLRPTDNGFEIAGVPEEIIQRFSKRRKAILEAEAEVSQELGQPLSNNARATLAQTTRDWKDLNLSPEEIHQYQLSQLTAEELATMQRLVPPNVSTQVAPPGAITEKVSHPSVSAKGAVDFARDHLFERKSVVPLYAFHREALAFGHGDLTLEEVEEEMAGRTEFLEFEGNLTTHEMIQREQEMLKLVNAGMGQFAPLNVTARPDSNLKAEQVVALKAVLNSPDWVTSIRGIAGSGKTELLKALTQGIQSSGRQAVVLAPTSAACGALRDRGVSRSSTLQNFLANPDFQKDSRDAVLIVDEAGLLSVGDTLQLLKVAQAGRCRVVLCGDTGQHTGIEAGDALRLLEERSAMQSAGLLRNHRQRNRDYREAIQAFSEGKATEGLSRLEALGALHEVDPENPYEGLVASYLKSVSRGKSSLIVSPTWREITQVTEAVRAGLKDSGRLDPKDTDVVAHTSLHWTRAQKRDLRNYREGMVLRFHRSTATVSRGASLTFKRLDGGTLIATSAEGTEVRLTGKQVGCFDVLKVGTIPVSAGEVLLVQANQKSHGLINGQNVQVSAVRPDGSLDLADGRAIPPEFRTFTHGYCVTSFGAQGRTVDHVFVAVGSESMNAANLNQFYVSASRGREQIQVFTDDLEELRGAVRRRGHRTAAVEFSEKMAQRNSQSAHHAVAMKL